MHPLPGGDRNSMMQRLALRGWLGVSVAAALAATLAGFGFSALGSGPRCEKRGCQYSIQDGDARYTFDAAWRIERASTVDPGTGRERDGAPVDADRLARMRGALLAKLGVERLDQIPSEGEAETRAIRALGYF